MLADVLRAEQPAVEIDKSRLDMRLKDLLAKSMKQQERNPPPEPTDYSRASSIGRVCARDMWLRRMHQVDVVNRLSADQTWMYGIGHAYNDLFQNRLLPMLPHGMFLGHWRCLSCGFVATGEPCADKRPGLALDVIPEPTKCDACGKENPRFCKTKDDEPGFRYVEISLKLEEYWLTGHTDGILRWEDGEEIVDYKTIRKESFHEVDPMLGGKALDYNVDQMHAYMLLTGIKRYRLVYITKGEGRFVESLVEQPGVWNEEIGRRIVQNALAVRDAISGGAIPCRLGGCVSINEGRPKSCPTGKLCFARG